MTHESTDHDQSESIQGHGVVAVIMNEDRYLMIQRALNITAGGMWCFVGGGVQANESLEDALVREVREEVGMVVRPVREIWQCESLNGKWLLHCWTTVIVDAKMVINPREVNDHDWMTASEIRTHDNVMPSVIAFLDRAD